MVAISACNGSQDGGDRVVPSCSLSLLPEEDDLVSVLSSSLTSSAHTMISATSTASTDVISYLESLKNFGEWSEEAKGIQRIVARRELRRQAKSAKEAADAWDAKLKELQAVRTRRVHGGHSAGFTYSGAHMGEAYAPIEDTLLSELPSEVDECTSIASASCLPEDTLCGKELWNRRLSLYSENPGPSYFWFHENASTISEEATHLEDKLTEPDVGHSADEAKAYELEVETQKVHIFTMVASALAVCRHSVGALPTVSAAVAILAAMVLGGQVLSAIM
mmetsp:Transcript_60565/g.169747  ORF Transcript_60565/g.169747 Transcript_60565/m.169747 type:complete len:278 (-) Transcript_60565:67-900(-)